MRKHKLKKEARAAEKKIKNENQQWFDDFLDKNYPDDEQKKPKKKGLSFRFTSIWNTISSSKSSMAIFFSATSLVIAGIIVCIWIFAFSVGPQPPPVKKYFSENETTIQVNLHELNSNMQGIVVDIGMGYESDINCVYDSISGDTLYYSIKLACQENSETISVVIYVNELYENKKELTDAEHIMTAPAGEFLVRYNEHITDEGWVFVLNYEAVFDYSNYVVYIEYEQLSLEPESNLFDFLQQTFKIA